MLPIIAGIVSSLISNNLPKVAQAVVDKGVDYVSEKLGVELKPDMTPEEIQKIASESMKHEEFMFEKALEDVQDARDIQKEALKQDDVFSKRFVYYFITMWSLASMVYIGFITFSDIPMSNVRFADTILGFVLGTCVAAMFQFLLGSSTSSKANGEAIRKALEDSRKG